MVYVLAKRVLCAGLYPTNVRSFLRMRKKKIARIEVFASLKLVIKQILPCWELSVSAKQTNILLGKRLRAVLILRTVHSESAGDDGIW